MGCALFARVGGQPELARDQLCREPSERRPGILNGKHFGVMRMDPGSVA
jgi:hypothetical protein